MQIKKVSQSRVIQNQLILPGDTNRHGSLFGGYLMSMIDSVAGTTFMRHTRLSGVTASMDQLNFINPILVNHSVCVEAMISGVGKRSVEIFVKATGEDLLTGERYLAATAFLVFVITADTTGFEMPGIEAETEEEAYIMKDYPKRRQARLEARQADQEFQEYIIQQDKIVTDKQ